MSFSDSRTFRVLFVGSLITTTLGMIGFACFLLWPVWIEYREVQRLRQDVLSAKNSWQAGKAYHALFESGGKARLQNLVDDSDTGISLQAAWRLTDAKHSFRTFAPKQFVEFLKRRTGVEVPVWWEAKVISESFDYDRERIEDALRPYIQLCPRLKYEHGTMIWELLHEYHKTDLGLLADEETTLAKADDFLVITMGDATVRVRESEIQQLTKGFSFPEHVAAQIGLNRS